MKKRLLHPHPVWRVARVVLGGMMVLTGVIFGFLPVLQGWILVLPGLLLLAPESRYARKIVVWLRTRLRLRRFRKAKKRVAVSEGAPSAGSETLQAPSASPSSSQAAVPADRPRIDGKSR